MAAVLHFRHALISSPAQLLLGSVHTSLVFLLAHSLADHGDWIFPAVRSCTLSDTGDSCNRVAICHQLILGEGKIAGWRRSISIARETKVFIEIGGLADPANGQCLFDLSFPADKE